MPMRQDTIGDAERRSRRQLDEVLVALTNARRQAGLSQSSIAAALGVSRALIGAWESARIQPGPVRLACWGAAVGLDISIRAFPGGAPLRDLGQVRLLERLRALVGGGWVWHTEVPISADPRDRRAIDAVISRGESRVGIEAVTRLLDAQGQVRQITLKQEASGIGCFLLVLSDSAANRRAAAAGRATVGGAFPGSARIALSQLRAGQLPGSNAVVFA